MLCICYHHNESVHIAPGSTRIMLPCSALLVAPALPSNSATAPGLQGGRSPHKSQAPVCFSTPGAPSHAPISPPPKRRGKALLFTKKPLPVYTGALGSFKNFPKSRSLRHCLNAELYIVLYQRLHV